MRLRNMAIGLTLAIAAAAASAERIELREKDMTAIDPSKAYVLISSELAGAMQIYRKATPAELAEWEVKREKARQKAERVYQSDLKLWQDKKTDPVTGQRYARPSPVDADFYYKPPELSNFINVMGREFVKDQDFVLLRLTPGEYVFYTLPGKGNGVAVQGQCLCMGTIGFTAEAGKIVSVGRFSGMANEREHAFKPASPTDPVPQSLMQFGVQPARLSAVGKLPNFNGSIVARLAAVPGVLGYSRDVPLDGAGQPVEGLR